jgi:hypothetical protein
MDAWTRRQYDEAQDKFDEAVEILGEIHRDQKTIFENRPVQWQRSEAGQAEEARLIAMDNLIQDLHDAGETIFALQPASCEPAPPHRAKSCPSPG